MSNRLYSVVILVCLTALLGHRLSLESPRQPAPSWKGEIRQASGLGLELVVEHHLLKLSLSNSSEKNLTFYNSLTEKRGKIPFLVVSWRTRLGRERSIEMSPNELHGGSLFVLPVKMTKLRAGERIQAVGKLSSYLRDVSPVDSEAEVKVRAKVYTDDQLTRWIQIETPWIPYQSAS